MSNLIVAASNPRAGRSIIAAGIAYAAGQAGVPVTLVRLAGDESASTDAAAFASLEGIVAPGTPMTAAGAAALPGTVVAEAPPGAVAELLSAFDARVLTVAALDGGTIDVPADRNVGTILNRVPQTALASAAAGPGVIAAIPEDRVLAAPSVADIARALDAKRIAGDETNGSIDRIMIGTVASDAATPYFAQRERICVVTRYDKTDIQLAALQTDLECLVITGGGEPSPYLIDRVRNGREDVAVLHVEMGTVDAVRALEPLFGASRFEGQGKLERAASLLAQPAIMNLFAAAATA